MKIFHNLQVVQSIEKLPKDDGRRREYRVLTMELQRTDNAAKQSVEYDLTSKSKETMKTLNDLATEGFEVRKLFGADNSNEEKTGISKVRILLERTK